MTLSLDPELAAVAEAAPSEIFTFRRGDWRALRSLVDEWISADHVQAAPTPDVVTESRTAVADDGFELGMRWYRHNRDWPGSAVLYIHGGGMLAGSVDNYDPAVRQYVQRTGVPFLAVDYRLAPENSAEGPARDAFAALRWLLDNAEAMGIDVEGIAVMGDSAGGGIAAAAAILSREAGLPIARQVLIFPMLDDRNTVPDSELSALASWTYEMNATGWQALLGQDAGSSDVSSIASPARLDDFRGLAPAYIEVGALDIFRDECISYAHRLLLAGVDTELHVHSGAPHGHDWMAISSSLTARCFADRDRVITLL